MECDNVLKLI